MMANKPAPTLHIAFQEEMTIGAGLNAISAHTMPSPLRKPTAETAFTPHTEHRADRKVIATTDEYKAIVKAAAAAQGAGFGWAGAAAFDFMHETKTSSTNVTLFDYCFVKTGFEVIRDVEKLELREDAARLLKDNAKRFVDEYGTHFVGGFSRGGYIMSTVTISTLSASEAQEIGAKLKVSYDGVVKADASTSFSKSLQAISEKFQLDASYRMAGGPLKKVALGDIELMMQEVDSYPESLNQGNGMRLTAICYPWEHLPCIQRILNESANLGPLMPDIRSTVLEHLADEMLRLEYLGKTADYLRDRKMYSNEEQRKTLDAVRVSVQDQRDYILGLTVDDLSTLSLPVAREHVRSGDIADKLEPIASGRRRIRCECTLGPNWDWFEYGHGATVVVEQQKKKLIVEFSDVSARDEFVKIASVHVPGKVMGGFYYKYALVDEEGKPNQRGSRKILAMVKDPPDWSRASIFKDCNGNWAGPNEISRISSSNGGLEMTARFV